MRQQQGRFLVFGTFLLLCFWGTRLAGVASFPPFLDETLHIYTTELATSTSPLVNADLARLFTIWWYALFYPLGTDNPIWLVRVASLLTVMVGAAAAIGVGRLAAGMWGGLLAGLFYLLSAYHMMFDRLALADGISSAAVLAAIYFALRLSRRIDWRDAALCGLALFAAFGAKTNAIPYFAVPVLAALTLHAPGWTWRRQIIWGAVALSVGLGFSAVLVIGLWLFGYDYIYSSFAFVVNSTWTFEVSEVGPLLDFNRIQGNILNTWEVMQVYAGPVATGMAVAAVAVLVVKRRFYLPLCLLLPVAILWVSRPQETRYWIAPILTLWLCAAVVLAQFTQHNRLMKTAVLAALVIWGGAYWLPFTLTAAQSPETLALPEVDRGQYLMSDAAGSGLLATRDYLLALDPDRVIGILSSCQGLRYLAWHEMPVECPRMRPDGQDIELLADLMANSRDDEVYVVLEDTPYAPDTAPGQRLIVVARPGNLANLTIYDLSPQ